MITSTQAFADSIALKARRTGVRVRLDVLTAGAVPDAWAQSNATSFSNPNQLTDDELDCTFRIATCEPNFIKLDGTSLLESTPEVGFVGLALSDVIGEYASPYPAFVVELSAAVNCQGFTIFFNRLDNEYAVDFDLVYKNGASVVNTYQVRANASAYYAQTDTVNGIDSINVIIYKWSKAKRRARVSEVAFGIVQIWGMNANTGLYEVTTQDEVDITNQSLPYGDAVVKVDNRSQEFNILNPVGIAKYLREGAKMRVFHGVFTGTVFEWVRTGTYLFKSWQDAGSNQVDLTALDTIGYFADSMPLLQNQTDIALTSVSLAAANLFSKAGLSSSWYDITGLSGVTGSDYLLIPYSNDFITELRSLAEYCCLVVICDAAGVIKFVDLPSVSSLTIPRGLTKEDAKITQVEQVKGVDISIYSKSIQTVTETILTDIRTISGTVSLVYDVGYTYNTITETVTGATSWSVTSLAYGKLTLSITASGSVTIVVFGSAKLSYPKQVIAVENAGCKDTNAPRLTIDNPHVTTLSKAQQIADWVIVNYNKWYLYQLNWIGDPRLEVMDQVMIGNRYGADRSAIVTKTALKYDGGLSENTEARGV